MARLVVVTQRVASGDPALGFFVSWLERLATRFEMIDVITLAKGDSVGIGNVDIHVLPQNRLRRFFAYQMSLVRLLPGSSGLFAHMCPEYVVAGGWVARLMRKPVLLWYAHRSVTWRLRVAALFANAIFTASPEGCRLKSNKVEVVGHGIDSDRFKPAAGVPVEEGSIVTVGRVSPIKRLENLLQAMPAVIGLVPDAHLTIVGGAYLPADREYERILKAMVRALGIDDRVRWRAPVDRSTMPDVYRKAALVVNLAPTGGLDKVVLEAMACARPVAAANAGFWDMMAGDAARGRVTDLSPQSLGTQIVSLLADPYPAESLRLAVIERHSLDRLADRIFGFFRARD